MTGGGTDLTSWKKELLKLDGLVEKLESRGKFPGGVFPGVPAGNGTVKILQRENRAGWREKDAADQRRW